MNVCDAVFRRELTTRALAHDLWLRGTGQTAEQDWLQAESEILGMRLKVVLWTKDSKSESYGRIDKSRCVSDIVHTVDGPTITDANGRRILLKDKEMSNRGYIVGVEV